jgi:steroid 5-alpha reductase family enzyme
MSLVVIWLLGWTALAAVMAGAWALQRALRNAGWVDAVWTFGLGGVGIAVALAAGPAGPAVAVLVGLWSLRLGAHIAARSRGAPEDSRYAALRRDWGAGYEARMFGFLQIQAAAAALLLVPIGLAASAPWPPGAPGLLGVAVILAGLAVEAVADAQLRGFRRRAKAEGGGHGRVCDTGLWGLSRHPNYVGEWLYWVGLALFALEAPFGWAALVGPAFIYWLLVHVSGIPPLEAQMMQSRGEAYAAYRRRVPPFLPRPLGRPDAPQPAIGHPSVGETR